MGPSYFAYKPIPYEDSKYICLSTTLLPASFSHLFVYFSLYGICPLYVLFRFISKGPYALFYLLKDDSSQKRIVALTRPTTLKFWILKILKIFDYTDALIATIDFSISEQCASLILIDVFVLTQLVCLCLFSIYNLFSCRHFYSIIFINAKSPASMTI